MPSTVVKEGIEFVKGKYSRCKTIFFSLRRENQFPPSFFNCGDKSADGYTNGATWLVCTSQYATVFPSASSLSSIWRRHYRGRHIEIGRSVQVRWRQSMSFVGSLSCDSMPPRQSRTDLLNPLALSDVQSPPLTFPLHFPIWKVSVGNCLEENSTAYSEDNGHRSR